jgi:hypothetical protein
MMAARAPFSRAVDGAFEFTEAKLATVMLRRFYPPGDWRVEAAAQRTVLAARLAANVLTTATKPAIMGE